MTESACIFICITLIIEIFMAIQHSDLQDSSKYPILADLSSAGVWMVAIFPLISSSPSLFSKPLGNIPNARTTIAITVILILHSFFSSLIRFMCMFKFSGVGRSYGVAANALDSEIGVNEFELKCHYHIHFRTNTFGKGKNPLFLEVMG